MNFLTKKKNTKTDATEANRITNNNKVSLNNNATPGQENLILIVHNLEIPKEYALLSVYDFNRGIAYPVFGDNAIFEMELIILHSISNIYFLATKKTIDINIFLPTIIIMTTKINLNVGKNCFGQRKGFCRQIVFPRYICF